MEPPYYTSIVLATVIASLGLIYNNSNHEQAI